MFDAMRVACLIQGGIHENEARITAKDVIKMATINGAKALKLEDKVGNLEEGKQADKYELDNLIVFVDFNNLQIDGTCDQVMPNGDLGEKFKSFGWEVLEIDGHDMEEICATLDKCYASKNGKPKCIYVTGGALIIGVPIGILMSIFMARFCPDRLHKVLKPIVDLLAGIPSIVYGFFGLVVMVPFVREHFKGNGQSILTAALLLGIMILPTIISVSESSIRAVEESYYEGALALGATHERSVFTVVVPAAKSGVFAAVVLGVGRALGETMAVMMVVGNQARVPDSIFKGVRTLTTNIVLEMGYATDLHREALIATGVVLFVFILIINISFSILKRRGKE